MKELPERIIGNLKSIMYSSLVVPIKRYKEKKLTV